MNMKRLMQVIVVVLVLSFFSLSTVAAEMQFSDEVATSVDHYLANLPAGFNQVKPDALARQLEVTEPFILDVRETNEFAGGFIAGAVNVPIRSLVSQAAVLPQNPNEPIIVYCASGTRGNLVMAALGVLGYTNVKNLSGGIKAWQSAGYPVQMP